MTAHASVSWHLNTGWTLRERQRELSSKCSEMEKGGEKIFRVSVSCGENCTLLALFILSAKLFKMCALLFGHPVFKKFENVIQITFSIEY
jgi:hypothetical protein